MDERKSYKKYLWIIGGIIVLAGLVYFLWPSKYIEVTIPPGLRKEQIADILSEKLHWTAAEKTEWLTVDTAPDADDTEGVYFPDTYLIPRTETPAETATRLHAEFEQQFAPYAAQALSEDIKWTTALKIASIIQREAAGTSDMPLISGIIWNRLNAGMPLDIDATVQYAVGTENDWWPQLSHDDLSIDSPYNTYTNAGLPPTPIDNPGLPAIAAALSPASTTCIYYLHDSSGQIHCSDTYAEQQANVAKYLQ